MQDQKSDQKIDNTGRALCSRDINNLQSLFFKIMLIFVLSFVI